MKKKQMISPLPQHPVLANHNMPGLTFPDAMREVLNGHKIRRLDWHNNDYCLLKGEFLTIFINNDFHQWLVNDGDMNATDWMVLPDGND